MASLIWVKVSSRPSGVVSVVADIWDGIVGSMKPSSDEPAAIQRRNNKIPQLCVQEDNWTFSRIENLESKIKDWEWARARLVDRAQFPTLSPLNQWSFGELTRSTRRWKVTSCRILKGPSCSRLSCHCWPQVVRLSGFQSCLLDLIDKSAKRVGERER